MAGGADALTEDVEGLGASQLGGEPLGFGGGVGCVDDVEHVGQGAALVVLSGSAVDSLAGLPRIRSITGRVLVGLIRAP